MKTAVDVNKQKVYDLAVVIPARNEQFLSLTVRDLLANKRGNTEVIVGLDGQWSNPPLEDHPDLTVIYYPESIGQRAMQNRCVQISHAKWIMKMDAHCTVNEGFDVKILDGIQDDWTVVPILYNLNAFELVCPICGYTKEQGPEPIECPKCVTRGNKVNLKREMIWKPKFGQESKKQEFYQFDTTLHFQYHNNRKKDPTTKGDFAETVSLQGSCFMITRKRYWDLNICDESWGSWGQQGVEVALKSWLSGGKVILNRKTWYSHLFRTQGGSFGFPWPLSEKQVEYARQTSRDLFFNNKWEKQIYPLSWLLDKFKPLEYWHTPKAKEMLDKVNKAGEEFYARKKMRPSIEIRGLPVTGILAPAHSFRRPNPTKGVVYYTDSTLPPKIEKVCQTQLLKCIKEKWIVSVSLKPMSFGRNVVLNQPRGWLTMFRQILLGLETLDTEYAYLIDHDPLYHPSHFAFIPTTKENFFYNHNCWRVRPSDGFALHYEFASGCVASRQLLVAHYRRRIQIIEDMIAKGEKVYYLKMGFEAGRNRKVFIDKHTSMYFNSEYPNIDVRWGGTNTGARWKKEEFRDKNSCKGWTESDIWHIPGWPNLPKLIEEFKV